MLVIPKLRMLIWPVVRVFALSQGGGLVQSHVKSYLRLKKWYLIPFCLILSIIRYGSRIKWSDPGKEEPDSQQLSVVAIENEAFGSPFANFTLLIANVHPKINNRLKLNTEYIIN